MHARRTPLPAMSSPSSAGQSSSRRYRVEQALASGVTVEVFRGWLEGSEGFRRAVLLKRLRSHLASHRPAVRAFVDEARLAAQLNHANVVQVLDVERVGEAPFIVMEYVDGPHLAALVQVVARTRVRRLPPSLAVLIVSQALKALDYAHRHQDGAGRVGIVHGGVRPSSLLISRDGQVKLSDFGVPQLLGVEALSQATADQVRCVAPEQLAGSPPDARSDIYSMGAVLFEALTGVAVFPGQNADAVRAAISRGALLPPSELVPRIPPELDAVVLKALATRPADRFQDADDFLRALMMATMPHFPAAASRNLARWVERLWKGPTAQSDLSGLTSLDLEDGAEITARVAEPRAAVPRRAATPQPSAEQSPPSPSEPDPQESGWSLGAMPALEEPEPAWARSSGGRDSLSRLQRTASRSAYVLVVTAATVSAAAAWYFTTT